MFVVNSQRLLCSQKLVLSARSKAFWFANTILELEELHVISLPNNSMIFDYFKLKIQAKNPIKKLLNGKKGHNKALLVTTRLNKSFI